TEHEYLPVSTMPVENRPRTEKFRHARAAHATVKTYKKRHWPGTSSALAQLRRANLLPMLGFGDRGFKPEHGIADGRLAGLFLVPARAGSRPIHCDAHRNGGLDHRHNARAVRHRRTPG